LPTLKQVQPSSCLILLSRRERAISHSRVLVYAVLHGRGLLQIRSAAHQNKDCFPGLVSVGIQVRLCRQD
jgi:hypothetical protein